MTTIVLFKTFEINKVHSIKNDSLLVKIFVRDNKEIFDQHFPDYPMLPGAFSIALVKECLDRFVLNTVFEKIPSLMKMESVSFIRKINPLDQLNLTCKWLTHNDNYKVYFMISNTTSIVCVRGIFIYSLLEKKDV